jgi:hypothetical protein
VISAVNEGTTFRVSLQTTRAPQPSM